MRKVTLVLLAILVGTYSCKARRDDAAQVRDDGATVEDGSAQLSRLAAQIENAYRLLGMPSLGQPGGVLALTEDNKVYTPAELDALRKQAAEASAAFRKAQASVDKQDRERADQLGRLTAKLDAAVAVLKTITPEDSARYAQGLQDMQRVLDSMRRLNAETAGVIIAPDTPGPAPAPTAAGSVPTLRNGGYACKGTWDASYDILFAEANLYKINGQNLNCNGADCKVATGGDVTILSGSRFRYVYSLSGFDVTCNWSKPAVAPVAATTQTAGPLKEGIFSVADCFMLTVRNIDATHFKFSTTVWVSKASGRTIQFPFVASCSQANLSLCDVAEGAVKGRGTVQITSPTQFSLTDAASKKCDYVFDQKQTDDIANASE